MLQSVSESVVSARRSFFTRMMLRDSARALVGTPSTDYFSSAPRTVSRSAVVVKELPRRQDLRKVLREIEEDVVQQFLYLHWCPNFGKCDERHCAEMTLSSLVTQTIAPDVQMEEQVVNKRWIIQKCRSRMEAILMTTTDGHERLERARDRFAQAAKEGGVEEPQRKRHRLEGEEGQSLAPPVSSNYQEGGCSSSGSALPPPPAPPPLEPPPLEKRGLDQETEMTDATVEQQRESKRRREHLDVPQATDSSSSSSSSSESSTDTEMGQKIPRPKAVVEVDW